MRGAAERAVQVYANGKEPIWNWFWRCHGWGLLGRMMAALGAVEMIGLLGFSQLQSEGGLLTFFFILSVMPALLAVIMGLALGIGFVVSLDKGQQRRSRHQKIRRVVEQVPGEEIAAPEDEAR